MLLTTLLGLLVFASLIIALQKLSASNGAGLVRLTDRIEENIGRSSVFEQLRGPIADAMTGQRASGVALDGSEFVLDVAGRSWRVQVQDVESLVDVYLSSSEVIGLTLPNPRAFENGRSEALRGLAPGERFPTLAASLARFGITDPSIKEISTQSGQHGSLRISNLPKALRNVALAPSVHEDEQVGKVSISIITTSRNLHNPTP